MGLAQKIGTYTIGNILIMFSGFISFPIFTRLLSTSDYGIMSLINLTSTLAVVFCKGGLQRALISDWSGVDEDNLIVINTALFGTVIITLSVFIIAGTCTFILSSNSEKYPYTLVFLITSGLVFAEAIRSVFLNKIRSEQKAIYYNFINLLSKYSQIFFAIIILTLVSRNVYSVFYGFMISNFLVVFWLFYANRVQIGFRYFRLSKFKIMIAFGFPLVFYELAGQFLSFIDRYFIGYFLGIDAVGKYSAAYNLTYYIQTLMITSVTLAIYPIVVEKINKDGRNACRKFIRDSLIWFSIFGSAVAFGFSSLGADILILTASDKYEEAARIISPIIFSGFLLGLFTLAIAEMFIDKNTKQMAIIMWICSLINAVLCFYFIPKMGLLGAAYSTLIPMVLLAVFGLWRVGFFSNIKSAFSLVIAIFPAFIMYIILINVNGNSSWMSIFERIILGVFVWFILTVSINSLVRERFLIYARIFLKHNSD